MAIFSCRRLREYVLRWCLENVVLLRIHGANTAHINRSACEEIRRMYMRRIRSDAVSYYMKMYNKPNGRFDLGERKIGYFNLSKREIVEDSIPECDESEVDEDADENCSESDSESCDESDDESYLSSLDLSDVEF